MQEKGMRVGLVTTATITHATPAGFAISINDRDLEGMIAEKYLTSGVDVLMGGGKQILRARTSQRQSRFICRLRQSRL